MRGLQRFKKRDPEGADEEEFVNNVVNTLCSSLLLPENQGLFIASEGLELMLILIKYAPAVARSRRSGGGRDGERGGRGGAEAAAGHPDLLLACTGL